MAKACLETSRRVLQTTTGQSEVQRVAVPRNLALSHLFNTIWIIIKIQVYILCKYSQMITLDQILRARI